MGKQAKPDIFNSAEETIGSIKGVIHDAESLLRMTAEFSSDSVSAAKEQFEQKLKAAKNTLTDLEESAVERYQKVAHDTDHYVHDRPWQAIAAAMALGMVLGGYLGHRSSARP